MKKIFLGVMAGLLFLTACSTPGPPRTYVDENARTRYYLTRSGNILRVDPDGTVVDVTCLSPKEEKALPRQELSKLPCEGGRVEVLGQAKKIGEDWDMRRFDIVQETGTCKSLFPYFQNERLSNQRHSCWHRLWEVPAALVVYPVVVVVLLGAVTAPIWVPLLLF